MFGGYYDIEAFEDDIYCEDSSSETSVDSEVEFHLYSQVHYAQALEDVSEQEETEQVEFLQKQSSISKQDQKNNFVVISDSDDVHITDSPDIITLSDTPDEDSIYKSKLQKVSVPKSPTLGRKYSLADSVSSEPTRDSAWITLNSKGLAPETSRKEKRTNQKSASFHHDDIRMIHKILVIEDSSTEEDADDAASTASESDNVESWMLLGGARDDKDDSILLNLEGCETSVSEGEGGVGWTVSDKDVEAQIGNYVTVRRNNRYYMPDKNVTCRNCDKRGHLSKNCPAPKKIPPCCLCAQRGHLQNNCPARFCLNCCLPGHCSRECLERTYWNKHCNRCYMRGHYADACPEIWRQYHLTTRPGPLKKTSSYSEHSALVYCYNCAQKGHYGYECSEKRMFRGTFPTFPFIYYYDDKYDTKRSTQRAKKKAQELWEAGLLPMALKRSYMNDDQETHGHKKKRKTFKECDKRGDKHNKRLRKKSKGDKFKGKKHKEEFQDNCNTEENFPRGGQLNALKRSKKANTHHDFGLATNRGKPEILQPSLEAKKKRKKKQRNNITCSPTRDESLFLIKQRKKKSKQKPSC
ncbi:zinc finger CCHC domain-containing protein 7 [Hemicordylus capensis]|uniref:zinc finger CCHC domain-containing protein 7 n=1 Tax=Hemicordylus capensis TaxID=884348 RepID=UPI002303F9B5|nr:zinc finger CCHC domain-containing protein 7 [Hemicordylus capensis]XP_053147270.1 zinc finger CCHC domain-containing protein 7 [Hemicordylus capensis]